MTALISEAASAVRNGQQLADDTAETLRSVTEKMAEVDRSITAIISSAVEQSRRMAEISEKTGLISNMSPPRRQRTAKRRCGCGA